MLNTSSKQNEHPSAKSTLDGNFPSRTKWANNKLATYAAMWSVGLGGALLERAKAGLYASGTLSQEMLDVGSHLKGRTLHLKVYSPIITSGSTNQSATFWNSQFAITSYHNISNYISNYTKIELSDTANYANGRDQVVTIKSFKVHPTEDVLLLEFSKPFRPEDKNGQPVPDQAIVPANPGEMTVAGGFGRWGTPATGLMNRDGGLRGWDGRVGGIIPSPSTRRTTFGYDNAGTRCNARGASGDSGGGTYILNVNASPGLEVGGLVGITDSASTFVADTGATTFLYLNHIKSWVEENTKVTIPPVVEPTLGCERGPGGGVTVSWDESANGWTLQKSGNLQEWENVGATISGIGSYTYSGNENRQFFRLKKP